MDPRRRCIGSLAHSVKMQHVARALRENATMRAHLKIVPFPRRRGFVGGRVGYLQLNPYAQAAFNPVVQSAIGAKYIQGLYSRKKKVIRPRMVYGKRKRSDHVIASRYFSRKRAMFTRARIGRPRFRIGGSWSRRRNMRARFRRSYRKRRYKASLITRCGVGSKQDQYTILRRSTNLAAQANNKSFYFVTSSVGLRDIDTFNQIYTNEALTDDDQGIVILNEKCEVVFKLQSDMAAQVTVHTVMFRRDWNSNYGTFADNVLNDGFQKVGLANSKHQELGTTLFMNNRFCHTMKVLRSRKLFLDPGKTTKVSMQTSKPKWMSYAYKAESTTNQLKGSIVFLFEIQGVPTHDSTTAANVGTSAPVIDVYLTKTCKYRVPDTKAQNVYQSATVTNPAAPVGFVDEDLKEDVEET